MLRFLRYSLRLRRVEYRVAELPIFLIPVLLTVRDASAFLSLPFWEGLLIFFFLFAFGDLLNCLADRHLDAIYKPHLTEAVYGLGVRGVAAQALVSALAALALAAHLSWLLSRWLLLPMVAAGLFVAYAYSVAPFRLKGRGLWQLAFYWLGLFTGPMVFAALLFRDPPPWDVLAVAVAFGMVQTGVILVNTAEDYPEDRLMGARTAVVALGLARGIGLAAVLAGVGSVLLGAALVTAFRLRQVPPPALAALLPLAAACASVTTGVWRLRRRLAGKTEAEDIGAVKRCARWVPLWITSVAVSALAAAVAAFWWGRAG
jgi:1,4-dihydroxy-2-naphthoate octaprenyltransferase